MGSYLRPNIAKKANFRGLRRIWEFLPTLHGIMNLPPRHLASLLGCLVGNQRNRSDLEMSRTNSALASSKIRIKTKTYRFCLPNLVPKKAFLGHSWASRMLYFALRRSNKISQLTRNCHLWLEILHCTALQLPACNCQCCSYYSKAHLFS